MDRDLQRICGLLQSADGLRRCAAAMVLTELAPKDAGTVRALGEALRDANQLLTRYILEAFDAIGTKAVVPHVLPLLNADDLETKLRAVGIVARVGGDVLPEIRRQFTNAAPAQKLVLVDVIARIHDRAALQVILDVLFETDFELVKEACQAVRRHIGDATPKARVTLHQHVVQFLGSARVKKNDRVLTSGLLLIGHIAAPAARNVLLKYAAPRHLGYIRRHALLGLKSLEVTGAPARATLRQLLPYLDETDPVIAQHTLDIVAKLPTETAGDAAWRKLLQGQHAPVRQFAARQLARRDHPATNKFLLTLLAHDDAQVGDIAAGALAHHPGATKLLLDALAKEREAEAGWRLAKILKPHAGHVDAQSLKKFAALAGRWLADGDARHEALLYFLRNTSPAAADAVVRDTGLRFKQARKWARAVECLRQLVNTEGFDAGLRYDLSVCNLKQSAKDLAPHLRGEDHALRGFQALLPVKPFKLLERLKKDKALDAADLCYVGFHFAELAGPAEAELGRALLEHVARKWPRRAEGKSARNKLQLAAAPAPGPAA